MPPSSQKRVNLWTEGYFDVRTTNVCVNWFRICTQAIACHCTALLQTKLAFYPRKVNFTPVT